MKNAYLYIAVATTLIYPFAQAQTKTEPGGNPADAGMAINQPFEYAWRLFFFLNHQAKSGTAGEPDESKETFRNYDDDKPVVWETWAAATGGLALGPNEPNRSEVYKAKGAKPGEWSQLPRQSAQPKVLEPTLTTIESALKNAVMPREVGVLRNAPGINPFFIVPTALGKDDEIRLNKATYDHIRDNYLYSAEGLKAAYQKAVASGNRDLITFPPTSKEVKARWIKIKPTDKPRYHWRSIEVTDSTGAKTTEVWGLSGFHILTKDLPNWFWTDFQHVDDEPQAIAEGRPSVDPTTREQFGQKAPSGENGVRNETKGSKWEYYRLRGTQVDFTDKFGKPTQLANTRIEPSGEGASSCITCHAKATTSAVIRPNTRPPFVVQTLPVVFVDGLPDPRQFLLPNGKPQFVQTDFLWSMPFRAHSETEP
ncbi:MAG: hypothetical protein M3N48_04805 [Verrucomicrobiota bacterium]|nr:hypothetical protein [Verrucomicrobiota bacterium]